MLGLMKEYNKLLERYKKAEKYFADETISIEDKQKQNENIIDLHRQIISVITRITGRGYIMTDEETEIGFRQIEFLDKGE